MRFVEDKDHFVDASAWAFNEDIVEYIEHEMTTEVSSTAFRSASMNDKDDGDGSAFYCKLMTPAHALEYMMTSSLNAANATDAFLRQIGGAAQSVGMGNGGGPPPGFAV